MIRLEKSEVWQKEIRQDDPVDLAIPTWKLVREAMQAGKIAAQSIHKHLRGRSLAGEYKPTEPKLDVPTIELTPEEVDELARPEMPSLPVEERRGNFKEVELDFNKELAIKEAKRCLRCDLESKGAGK